MYSGIYRCFFVFVFGLALIHPVAVSAHAEHHQPAIKKMAPSVKPSVSVSDTPKDGVHANVEKDRGHHAESVSPHLGHDHESMISGPHSWSKALWEHWHHKVIHYPIALGIFAALLLIGGLKWDFCYPVASVALGIAFVFGIVAYFSGQSMLTDFSENSPYLPLVDRHRQLGIISIVFLGLGTVGACLKKIQAWMWIYALVLISLISATGFYGGWIAHG